MQSLTRRRWRDVGAIAGALLIVAPPAWADLTPLSATEPSMLGLAVAGIAGYLIYRRRKG